MHHRRSQDLDVDGATGGAVRGDDGVLHVFAAREGVGHRVQFAGPRVTMRVGGIAAGEGPVEIARTDRVEFVGEFVVRHAALDESQGLAGVGEHIGVGAQGLHSGAQVAGGGHRLRVWRPPNRASAPAVPIPIRFAAVQCYAVTHAVAGEPVIGGGVDLGDGIGTVAQVAPVEEVGDVTGNRAM